MKRIFFFCLAFILASCHSEAQNVLPFLLPNSDQTQYAEVYILGGQSNMSGAAPSAGIDAQYTGALNAYMLSTYGSGTNTRNATTLTWQRLELDKNNNNEGINGVSALGFFGPEIVFGKKMSDLKPNRIFIIKVAYNASSMLGEGSTNDWKLGGPGIRYADLSASVIIGLNKIVSDFNLTPRIRGFLWMQGEAERDGTADYSSAPNLQSGYILQCSRMVQFIIDDIVENNFDTKSMRVCFGRIHNSFSPVPSPTSLAAIRAAHVDLGTNFRTNNVGYQRYCAGVTYIDTDAFDISTADHTHFTQLGQISLGTAYYNYFSQYVDEIITVTPASTSGFDTDAAAFVTTAGLTNQTHANAVNALVSSLKTNSVWTIAPAIYPFIGGNRKANKLNLKDPTNLLGYNLTFNTGVKHTVAGFDGNIDGGFTTAVNPTGYANTNIPFNVLGQNTAGFAYYSPTATQEAKYGMGVMSAGNTSRLYFPASWTDNHIYTADMSAENGTPTNTDGSGTFVISRTSSSNYNIYVRGTKTSISASSVAPDANTFVIGGRNSNGVIGSISFKTWAYFQFFNTSLSDTNESNLRSAVTTFQTAVR